MRFGLTILLTFVSLQLDAAPSESELRCAFAVSTVSFDTPQGLDHLLATVRSLLPMPARSKPTSLSPEYRSEDQVTGDKDGIRICRGTTCQIESGYAQRSTDGPGYEVVDRVTQKKVTFPSARQLLKALQFEIEDSPSGRRLVPQAASRVPVETAGLGPVVRQDLLSYRIDGEFRQIILSSSRGPFLVRPPDTHVRLGTLVGRSTTYDGFMLIFRNAENTHYVQLIQDEQHDTRATQRALFSDPEFVPFIDPALMQDLIGHGLMPAELAPPELRNTIHPLGVILKQ